ncbi:hypothetical protein [Streptomyces sp. NPDC005780]|uniref:hypothetical protein n=1 Tax=Streptomyces sp. NPDC005780 TaxID=3364730 RepID=UPI0036D0F63B
MPFHNAWAPGQSQAGDDGVAVAVDACGEGVRAGQVVLPDGVESVGQALALALGEHGREGADVPGEGIEFWAVRPYGLELELFGLGEEQLSILVDGRSTVVPMTEDVTATI